MDLQLVRVPPCYQTLLIGKILCFDYPVINATVLIFNCDGSPCYHTTTDENGIYRFRNILAPGIYSVIVSAVGYHTTLSKTVYVCEDSISYLSFEMEQSLCYSYGVIAGQIIEFGNWIPVDDVEIYLRSVGCGRKIYYSTRTNYNGFYMIYDILPDYYQLTLRRNGFEVTESIISINKFDHITRNLIMYRK